MEGNVETRFSLDGVEARKNFLEDYIHEAIDLYKDKDYQSVIRHLKDTRAAEWAGFILDEFPTEFIVRETPSEEEIDELVARIAFRSSFNYGPEKSGEIKISSFFVTPPEGKKKEDIKIPERLWQEVALIHLEEWTHGLQHLNGDKLSGGDNMESDVAKYLQNKGVELTEWFLKLHR